MKKLHSLWAACAATTLALTACGGGDDETPTPTPGGQNDDVVRVTTSLVQIDVLVTDHGIAVNPARQDLIDNLRNAGIQLMTIEELQQRAELLTGKPDPIAFTDRVVAVVRYRDGSVIDVIHQVKSAG